jgi:hypothetical protein
MMLRRPSSVGNYIFFALALLAFNFLLFLFLQQRRINTSLQHQLEISLYNILLLFQMILILLIRLK